MNDKDLKILLNYYKGILNEDELELHKQDLKKVGIILVENDNSGKIKCFLDEFTNQFSLMLNNPLIQAYTLGLTINTGYDVVKKTIIWMWNGLIGKKITKIKISSRIREEKEATFGLHLRIDDMTNIDFRLDGDVSDELKSKCIDRVFEIIDTVPRGKMPRPIDWFAIYNWETEEWHLLNTDEEIRKRFLFDKNQS